MNIKSVLLTAAMAAVSANSFADASQPDRHVQEFLNALNGAGGKPIEQLSPQDARQVLINAQKGAKLPAADVTEKTINVDGGSIKLHIVKPHNAQGPCQYSCSSTAVAGYWAILRRTNVSFVTW
jgi:hypothetical protein